MRTYEQMKSLGILPGQELYVLGFPLGISGINQKYVIVREGIIARLDDETYKNPEGYLIDCSIFPGNSGSPVFTRPTFSALNGTKPIKDNLMIGIVKGYTTYRRSASHRKDGLEINIYDNAHLARVIPVDKIFDILHPSSEDNASGILKMIKGFIRR